jgi:hypothetical protein
MLALPFGPSRRRKGEPNGRVSVFRLERTDGTPAEPSSLSSAVPNWAPGHEIHFGDKTLVVVAVRDDDAEQPPTLVVKTSSS